MSSRISSAEPEKLFRYADRGEQIAQEAFSTALRLMGALLRFVVTCTEYGLDMTHLSEGLRVLAQGARATDEWVRQVGIKFLMADQIGSILRPLPIWPGWPRVIPEWWRRIPWPWPPRIIIRPPVTPLPPWLKPKPKPTPQQPEPAKPDAEREEQREREERERWIKELVASLEILIGTSVDFDGKFGFQCVDLVRKVRSDIPGGKGYAKNYMDMAIRINAEGEPKPGPGDVLVWDANVEDAGETGHVAIVESVNPDGTVNIVEQNWPEGTAEVRRRSNVRLTEGMGFIPYP